MELTFHHVGVVTRDLESTARVYRALGYTASERYEDPLQGVAIVFMRREDSPLVELVSPLHAESPAHGWLKRTKAGPYHTCYEVAVLEDALELLRAEGFTPTGTPLPAVAFGGRRVVFSWSNEAGLLELLESK